MKTFELLPLFWPGVLAGIAAAFLCGPLSVYVASRRLAFMTQGVSHAAMGGAGIAALIGATGASYSAVTAAACLAAALLIALISARGKSSADTAVGVVLVASMALGALLLDYRLDHPIPGAPRPPSWESLLFGSILTVRPADAYLAAAVATIGLATLWLARRPLLATTLDPLAARAAGVNSLAPALLLAALIGAGVVVAMKLVGVVLATALLVLPGAGALRLPLRVTTIFVVSTIAALAGVLLGLIAAFETDAPPGASSALTLTLWWIAATFVDRTRTAS